MNMHVTPPPSPRASLKQMLECVTRMAAASGIPGDTFDGLLDEARDEFGAVTGQEEPARAPLGPLMIPPVPGRLSADPRVLRLFGAASAVRSPEARVLHLLPANARDALGLDADALLAGYEAMLHARDEIGGAVAHCHDPATQQALRFARQGANEILEALEADLARRAEAELWQASGLL